MYPLNNRRHFPASSSSRLSFLHVATRSLIGVKNEWRTNETFKKKNLISHPGATVSQQSYFSTLKNFSFEHIGSFLYVSEPHLNTWKFDLVRDLVLFEKWDELKGNGQFLGHRSGPWGWAGGGGGGGGSPTGATGRHRTS